MGQTARRMFVGLVAMGAVVAQSAPTYAQAVQTRWRNADTTNGTFYLGISGGKICNGWDCWVNHGTNIITYQSQINGNDQFWSVFEDSTNEVINQLNSSTHQVMCLGVSGGSTNNGAPLIIWECNGNSQDQYWQVKKAEDYGAPYAGCFVFINTKSGQVMGVSNGVVKNGSQVIQWPFYQNPFHVDQFWCPQ